MLVSEKIKSYTFLRPAKDPLPPTLASIPVRYMTHTSFLVGERVVRPGTDLTTESGYQVHYNINTCQSHTVKHSSSFFPLCFQALRLATELIPATFAVIGPEQLSPFWSVLFYFVLILFGIAQQMAIWHCVITGIMAIKASVLKSWETTITFFSCVFGFLLGLPMATEVSRNPPPTT